jgi:hypothetical protein
LSNASPAASSMVAPSGSTPRVTSSTAAATSGRRDQHRQARLGQRAVLELVDGDVRGEVVDAVERLAEPERERLGRRDPDQQRAGQPGPLVTAIASTSCSGRRRSRRRARWSAPSPRGAPGWRPRARRRRSGRARRRLAHGVGQQRVAADDADAGLVARGLDAEHQRFDQRHSSACTTASYWLGW